MKRQKQSPSPSDNHTSPARLNAAELDRVAGGRTKIEVDVGTPVNLPGGWRDILNDILD